jgi:hypothetical protein
MRFVIVEISDAGALELAPQSDDVAGWELIGIAAWLDTIGHSELIPEQSEEGTDTE